MRLSRNIVAKLVIAVAFLCGAAAAQPREDNGPVRRTPNVAAMVPGRLLVLWKSGSEPGKQAQLASHARAAGTSVAMSRDVNARLQVLELAARTRTASEAMLAKLRADPRVSYAGYDERKFPHALPNDTDFLNQWYLQATQAASIRAQTAWDTSTGNSGVVIADLDTGIRYDHPDLERAAAGGKLLPGYDFVTNTPMANDGGGRDADPSDPGDWVSASDLTQPTFSGCTQSDSSWHGTRTAGIMAALTNNGAGIAGISWNSYLLPVRVLGKCGGWDSDILDAMRWAAGLPVAGAPVNPYPARIINMSLGSTGSCTQAYRDVINEVAAAGTLVVVSAGNEGDAVDTPANCAGAVAVAGLRHLGTKVGFSNLGPEVAISAPGGNCGSLSGPCLYTIDTTYDVGTTVPAGPSYTDQINFNVGTSFSAPLVSGVASLMMGVNANLLPSHVRRRLQEGATQPFPRNADPTVPDCQVPGTGVAVQDFECNCTTDTCGAGMLNAAGALAAAERPIASVALPASVAAGQNVSLGGSRSVAACGRTITSYQWSVVSGSAVIANANQADASVPAPAAGSTLVARLLVSDDRGATDTADVTITSSAATSSVPTITPVNSCPTAINVATAPIPTATLSANPTTIGSGQSSTLTWSSTDAAGCTASDGWSGNLAASGSQSTGALTATSSFTITCTGIGGTSSAQTVTVTVNATPMSSGGGGGGGGAWDELSLVGLGLLLLTLRRAQR